MESQSARQRKGTLCAAVKVARGLHVWRKTLEEFTERNLDLDGPAFMTNPATKPTVGFEEPFNEIGGGCIFQRVCV